MLWFIILTLGAIALIALAIDIPTTKWDHVHLVWRPNLPEILRRAMRDKHLQGGPVARLRYHVKHCNCVGIYQDKRCTELRQEYPPSEGITFLPERGLKR